MNLGDTEYGLGEWDKALSFYYQAIELILYMRPFKVKIDIYRKLGKLKEDRSIWDEALDNYHKAVKISKKFNNEHLEKVYRGIGRVYWRKGNLKKAAEYFNKSIPLARKSKDNTLLSNLYVDLGNIYSETGNAGKAIMQYNKGLNMLDKAGNMFDKSRIYNNSRCA